MRIKELKKIIKNIDDNRKVVIWVFGDDGVRYGYLEPNSPCLPHPKQDYFVVGGLTQ